MENKETGSIAGVSEHLTPRLTLKRRAGIIAIEGILLMLAACDINSPPNPPTPTPEPPWPAVPAPQTCEGMSGADYLLRARLGFCRCPKTLEEWGQAFREIFDTGVCVYRADGRLETY